MVNALFAAVETAGGVSNGAQGGDQLLLDLRIRFAGGFFRRDELTFLTDVDEEDPTAAHLIEIRDQIAEIIATGTVQERKSMCEALLAELRIDGGVVTPVIRIPISRDDTPLILQTKTRTADDAVRARPRSVEPRGLEPLTPTLPVWCATSCATSPRCVFPGRPGTRRILHVRPTGAKRGY